MKAFGLFNRAPRNWPMAGAEVQVGREAVGLYSHVEARRQ
jgi:hypothetical protein